MEVNLIINTIQNRPSTKRVHVLFFYKQTTQSFFTVLEIFGKEKDWKYILQNKIVKVRVLISECKLNLFIHLTK